MFKVHFSWSLYTGFTIEFYISFWIKYKNRRCFKFGNVLFTDMQNPSQEDQKVLSEQHLKDKSNSKGNHLGTLLVQEWECL